MSFLDNKIPLGHWVESGLDFLTEEYSGVTRTISDVTENAIFGLNDLLFDIRPELLIILFALLAWKVGYWRKGLFAGNWRLGIFTAVGFALIYNLGLWDSMLESFTLVLFATVVAVALAVPLGILAALYEGMYRIIMPVLDFMQTMPAFVYLIPAIPFFGIGPVAAIFATVIFSMPPAIRFTTLGIRQVPTQLIEAADAFGSTKSQKLLKLQLPMAVPTMMAGINQTIMLALSMVVIAAMIGADGLGGDVWKAIQRLQPGKGFEAGLAVVILAMVLDRMTQKLGQPKRQSK